MEELKGRLTRELQQDFNVKIMGSSMWNLPVHSIEITFHTFMRTKMDILMKMMLIAFQKATIETAEELSDILLVEQLFINDLLNKMVSSGLIEKKGSFFTLTNIGVQQLETGIFEHKPQKSSSIVRYSPAHQSFLTGEIKNTSYEQEGVYRFKEEFDATSLEDAIFVEALKDKGVESVEGNVQIVVSEILSTADLEVEQIPCIEFHLYNSAEDLLYARVWNTLSEQWDATLEAQLGEKERKKWREMYL